LNETNSCSSNPIEHLRRSLTFRRFSALACVWTIGHALNSKRWCRSCQRSHILARWRGIMCWNLGTNFRFSG